MFGYFIKKTCFLFSGRDCIIINIVCRLCSMANISKNAKTSRGSNEKNVFEYNGKEVEVCAAMFFGNFVGMGNYRIVEDKSSKSPLVDKDGMPLAWELYKSKIKRKKA